jgi:glycine cleavage system transcriptional repressor
MNQALIAIVGHDRPGIVYQVSRILANQGCQILTVSQTTLVGQFSGLFFTKIPEKLTIEELSQAMADNLESSLSHWVTKPGEENEAQKVASEPYVLTILGPDNPEVIPEVTKTVASFEVNIDNLRAVTIGSNGSTDAPPLALVLEISVPATVKQNVFRQALSLTAEEQGIEISLQHRDIFEAIHRV